MKTLHRTLKAGTPESMEPSFRIGDWKIVRNMVGGTETARPEDVDREIGLLLERTPNSMTFDDIVRFHYEFEVIHPLTDGNGRVGRLLMFQQTLQNGIMPFVVRDHHKAFYHRGLKLYPDQPGFLEETLRSAQDTYFEEYREFIPLVEEPSAMLKAPPAVQIHPLLGD